LLFIFLVLGGCFVRRERRATAPGFQLARRIISIRAQHWSELLLLLLMRQEDGITEAVC